MHTRMSRWTVLGGGLLIGGALLACKNKKQDTPPTPAVETAAAAPTVTAPPAAPATTFSVGETAKASDYSLAVDSVKQCKPRRYSKPKKGNIWLGVEMVVGAIGDKQVWSNPSYAKLIDGDGLTYNSSYGSTIDCEPRLRATQLNNGEKAKGWVVFEVPQTVSGLKLTYNPSRVGKPQQVKFDLGELPGKTKATTATAPARATTVANAPSKPAAAPKKESVVESL
jgi:hypothetical protein